MKQEEDGTVSITRVEIRPKSAGRESFGQGKRRKLTSTYVAANGASDATIRTVATHMTHAANTARKYYQHVEGVTKSIQAYDDISTRKRRVDEEEPLPIMPRLK